MFCEKSLKIARKTKQIIMDETRESMESETREIFFNLIWKKETFKSVNIDAHYNLSLKHASGYDCLGTISAAERKLLALSFTLALHKISGFDSPILIDTPLSSEDPEHKKNFSKMLTEVTKNKQIILLFTPTEYSEEVSNILDGRCVSRLISKLSSDELEVKMESIL